MSSRPQGGHWVDLSQPLLHPFMPWLLSFGHWGLKPACRGAVPTPASKHGVLAKLDKSWRSLAPRSQGLIQCRSAGGKPQKHSP